MGYTIRIGQAQIQSEWPTEDFDDEPFTRWTVEATTSDQAPTSSDSGQSNGRSPGYADWSRFAREVDLSDWFFHIDDGKLRRHPGCFKLTQVDNAVIHQKLVAYRSKNPDKIAGWCECIECSHNPDAVTPHNPNLDGNLVRLEWLAWWVEWAVSKGTHPAIWNR